MSVEGDRIVGQVKRLVVLARHKGQRDVATVMVGVCVGGAVTSPAGRPTYATVGPVALAAYAYAWLGGRSE